MIYNHDMILKSGSRVLWITEEMKRKRDFRFS